jgi:hypothetical protein
MKTTVASEGTIAAIAANGSAVIPPSISIFPVALPAGYYLLSISITNAPGANTTFRVNWQEEYVVSQSKFGIISRNTVGRQWRINNLTANPVSIAFKIYRIEET